MFYVLTKRGNMSFRVQEQDAVLSFPFTTVTDLQREKADPTYEDWISQGSCLPSSGLGPNYASLVYLVNSGWCTTEEFRAMLKKVSDNRKSQTFSIYKDNSPSYRLLMRVTYDAGCLYWKD